MRLCSHKRASDPLAQFMKGCIVHTSSGEECELAEGKGRDMYSSPFVLVYRL